MGAKGRSEKAIRAALKVRIFDFLLPLFMNSMIFGYLEVHGYLR